MDNKIAWRVVIYSSIHCIQLFVFRIVQSKTIYREITDASRLFTHLYGPYDCINSDDRVRRRFIWPGDESSRHAPRIE